MRNYCIFYSLDSVSHQLAAHTGQATVLLVLPNHSQKIIPWDARLIRIPAIQKGIGGEQLQLTTISSRPVHIVKKLFRVDHGPVQ